MTDRERWTQVFDECLLAMASNYNRKWKPPGGADGYGFPFSLQRLYLEACEGWSIDKLQKVFRKAIESEEFCPTVAKIKAYGAGIRDGEAPRVVEEHRRIVMSAEERADVERMKADLNKKFANMPWSKPLPATFFK